MKTYLVLLSPAHINIVCNELDKFELSYIILDYFYFDVSQFNECCIWELTFSDINNFDLINPKKIYNKNSSSNSSCKYTYAILYIGPHIKNDYKLYSDAFFGYILPDGFSCTDLHYSKNKCILHYSNIQLKKHVEHDPETVVLFWGDGLGDIFICYYLLTDFFYRMQNEKKNIIIFLHDRTDNESIKTIFKYMFVQYNIKFIYIKSIYLLEFYYLKINSLNIYYKCYDLLLTTKKYSLAEGLHVIDVYSRLLCMNETYNYNFNNKYNFINSNILPDDEIRFIHEITKTNKQLIGLQFWTGSFDKPSYRCWEYEMVRQLDLLTNEKYILINLTPYPKYIYKNLNFIDASYLSILGITYLISKIDFVVSIDSLCGHIAAMTGTPSITLWMNGSSPLNMLPNPLITIGTRPLRSNISIVQKSNNPISAQIVFQTIENVFNKIIVPKKTFISYLDSRKGKNIIFYKS